MFDKMVFDTSLLLRCKKRTRKWRGRAIGGVNRIEAIYHELGTSVSKEHRCK